MSEDWGDQTNQIHALFGGKRRSSAEQTSSDKPRKEKTKAGKRTALASRKRRSSKLPSWSSSTSIESRVKLFRKSLSRRRSHDSGRDSSSVRSVRRRTGDRAKRRSQSTSSSSSSGRATQRSTKSRISSARLPSFLKQPLPRGTESHAVLKDDPKLHKRKNTLGKASRMPW